jgi:hypothetical protein
MRSVISAYAAQEAEYLAQRRTLREYHSKKISLSGQRNNGWQSYKEHRQHSGVQGLFLNAFGKNQIHHELSTLSLRTEAGFRWYVLLVINSSRIYILREIAAEISLSLF